MGRLFAAIYDRLAAGSEDAGVREMRARVVGQAHGRALELGAGTGLNLAHYTDAVLELVLTEPDRHMAAKLRERLAAQAPPPGRVEIVETQAEALPFDEESFDSAVGTFVLCTVDNPRRVADELRRVLRAGGSLLFLEHVRSDDERTARWQDRLERPWGWIAGGCHPNRDTAGTLSASGFELRRLDAERVPKALPIVRPAIRGMAVKPGQPG
jgi:ubiquinone/menaquinone biosynthesis C-methylase UbiE